MKKNKSTNKRQRKVSITIAQLDDRMGLRTLADDALSSITGGGNAVYPSSCGKHPNL